MRLHLQDRFWRLRCCDRVCVATHELPGAALVPEDAGDAESDRGELVAAADLGLEALYLHDTSEIIRDVPGDGLEADDLTLAVARRSSGRGLGNLLPAASERAKRKRPEPLRPTDDIPLRSEQSDGCPSALARR